jgi:creatinine amidohydrolase
MGDGSFGGDYERSDEETARVWRTAVTETRALLEEGW